jgi:hypothetical protein
MMLQLVILARREMCGTDVVCPRPARVGARMEPLGCGDRRVFAGYFAQDSAPVGGSSSCNKAPSGRLRSRGSFPALQLRLLYPSAVTFASQGQRSKRFQEPHFDRLAEPHPEYGPSRDTRPI